MAAIPEPLIKLTIDPQAKTIAEKTTAGHTETPPPTTTITDPIEALLAQMRENLIGEEELSTHPTEVVQAARLRLVAEKTEREKMALVAVEAHPRSGASSAPASPDDLPHALFKWGMKRMEQSTPVLGANISTAPALPHALDLGAPAAPPSAASTPASTPSSSGSPFEMVPAQAPSGPPSPLPSGPASGDNVVFTDEDDDEFAPAPSNSIATQPSTAENKNVGKRSNHRGK